MNEERHYVVIKQRQSTGYCFKVTFRFIFRLSTFCELVELLKEMEPSVNSDRNYQELLFIIRSYYWLLGLIISYFCARVLNDTLLPM
jgi:hypothetical protein